MRSKKAQIIVLTLAAAIVAIFVMWQRVKGPDANTVKISKVLKVDANELNTIYKIRDSMIAGRPFTEDQWQQLLPLIKSSNTEISGQALTILASTTGTKFSQRSVEVGRQFLNAPTGLQRAIALAILYHHGADDWKPTAEGMLHDESSLARERARDFLNKGSRKSQ